MKLGLEGKTALVTGSSHGIGRGIALGLASEGCRLMLTGRDVAALEEVATAIRAAGGEAHSYALDLRRTEAPAQLIEQVQGAFGRLDILVNNAGATTRGDFPALSDADWQDGFALKFFAHVRLARAAWPMLRDSGGSVVTIAGNGARMPSADFTIGSTVNAGCLAFTKALADLGKRDGVQVNAINPGVVETERFWRRLAQSMERTGQDEATARREHQRARDVTRFGLPEDIAGLVAFIVSPRGRWLHGATIDMDGGEVRSF